MSKIILVENGIFPIKYNREGDLLIDLPETGINETGTIQGEGKLQGIVSLFIRTSNCNLRCAFYNHKTGEKNLCDTPYSSHNPESNKLEIDVIVDIVKQNTKNGIKHIVISGGEPTLQTKPLEELLEALQKEGYHTTIETNATIYSDKIAQYTNLFSMSPKLKNSNPTRLAVEGTAATYNEKWELKHEKDRKNIEVIQKYIDSCYDNGNYEFIGFDDNGNKVLKSSRKDNKIKDFQLKFVVTNPEDVEEIKKEFLQHLKGVEPQDVLLMPEGITNDELNKKSLWIVEECLKNGFRYCPRLHINLFGKARAV